MTARYDARRSEQMSEQVKEKGERKGKKRKRGKGKGEKKREWWPTLTQLLPYDVHSLSLQRHVQDLFCAQLTHPSTPIKHDHGQ